MDEKIRKAEADVYDAQTRLIHIKAVLAAYPAAVEQNGRLHVADVKVVGMEWVFDVGKRGAYVFFGAVPSERGPARVYDKTALPLEVMTNLPSNPVLAHDLHRAAVDLFAGLRTGTDVVGGANQTTSSGITLEWSAPT